MPSYTRGVLRENFVAVRCFSATADTYFGFKTKDFASLPNVSESDIQALGFLLPEALPNGSLLFVRANAPKPPRARKVILKNPTVSQQGSISSYFSIEQSSAVLAAGWTISKAAMPVALRATARFTTAIAKVSNGAYYCWNMNTADFAAYAEPLGLLSSVNITSATERAKLVRGASLPRPARAVRKFDDAKSFSTFVSFDKIDDLGSTDLTLASGEKLS